MKSGATAGTYVVAVQGGDETVFVISNGAASVEGDTPVAQKEKGNSANGTYSAAYVVEVGNISEIKTIKFMDTTNDIVYGIAADSVWDIASIDSGTTVTCGIQIDDIPEASALTMYLSTDETTSVAVN